MPSLFAAELEHSKFFCDLLDQLDQELKDSQNPALETFANLSEAWGQILKAQAWTAKNANRSKDAAWQCCRFAMHCNFNSNNILGEYDGFSFQSRWLEDAKGLVPDQNVEQFLAINQSAFDLMSTLDTSKQLLTSTSTSKHVDFVASVFEIVKLYIAGENSQAIVRLNELCEVVIRKEQTDNTLICLRLLAICQLDFENSAEALSAAIKAIEILEDLDAKQLIRYSELYVVYARCLVANEKINQAELECKKLWNLLTSTDQPFAQNINYTSLFRVWANCSRNPIVESYLEEFIEYANLNSKKADESKARLLRSRIHMRNGDLANSRQAASLARDIAFSIRHKEYKKNAESQLQILADLKSILQSDDLGRFREKFSNITV